MKQPLTLALLCVIIAVIVADDPIATLRASLATNKNDFDLNWALAGTTLALTLTALSPSLRSHPH